MSGDILSIVRLLVHELDEMRPNGSRTAAMGRALIWHLEQEAQAGAQVGAAPALLFYTHKDNLGKPTGLGYAPWVAEKYKYDMSQYVALYGEAVQVGAAPAPTLTERLQQKCSDWGVYWRASDAHGVVLTNAQASELLRDALGVEVEWSAQEAAIARTESGRAQVGAAPRPLSDFPELQAAVRAGVADGSLIPQGAGEAQEAPTLTDAQILECNESGDYVDEFHLCAADDDLIAFGRAVLARAALKGQP